MRVIKLGGSLLDWSELPQRLLRFLSKLDTPDPTLILVGGGQVVEAIRRLDLVHHLAAIESHWLCVDLMGTTARLLQALIAQLPLIDRPSELDGWLDQVRNESGTVSGEQAPDSELAWQGAGSFRFPVAIVSPAAFYSRELLSEALPKSWDTTSDSISALLACRVSARELILLKSAGSTLELPSAKEGSEEAVELLAQLQTVGFLDQAFNAGLVENLEVRIVNFRAWQG